jgi:uncharacterized protein (TIGR03437 family)
VNGVAVPLLYVSASQVNAQIPFETQAGDTQVQVTSLAGTAAVTAHVVPAAPAVFTLNMQGSGPGAILHDRTYAMVTDTNPAAPGEIILIYCTGLGALNPPVQTGEPPALPPSQTVILAQVTIGGTAAQVQYAGVAPGYAGLYQINAQVPPATPSGAQPLFVTANGVTGNTVTVAIH